MSLVAAAAAALTLLVAGGASSYGPAPLASWVVSGGGSGGSVEAVAVSGTTAYVGGDFGYIGPETGSFVSLDSSSAALTAGLPVVGGNVYAVAPDGVGGWFLGGYFASIGPSHVDNLAHIKADGSLDTGWAASTDGPVYTLATSGATVFAGGFFDHAGGAVRGGLAGFNATTGALTSLAVGVGGDQPLVATLELSGSTLYVGGLFDHLGGAARANLGAIDLGVGQPTTWDPRASNLVNAIAVGPTGTVYAGGFFQTVNNGTARKFVAAFDVAGTATNWNPNANAEVYAVEAVGSTIYLGGAFGIVGGQMRPSLAAVNDTSGTATGWNPRTDGAVYQIAVAGSTVYTGGSFRRVNLDTPRNNIAAFEAVDSSPTGAVTPFETIVGGDVFALAAAGSKVAAGGTFRTVGGGTSGNPAPVQRDNIASIDLNTGRPTTWNPRTNDTVFALAVSGSTVYAGGAFTAVNGTTMRGYLAAFADNAGATTWTPNANDTVFALTTLGSTVYAGGAFTAVNGGVVSRSRVAAFTASGTGNVVPGWHPDANGDVLALDGSGSTIYIGGDFTTLGGQTRGRLGAVATNGTLSPWNPNANDVVYALTHVGSTEYAGGAFTTVNDNHVSRKGAAAFDGTGTATSWDPRLTLASGGPPTVFALAPTSSTMYIAGDFHTAGDCAASCVTAPVLAAVSLRDGGALASWRPVANGLVTALGTAFNGVVAGGSFTALGYPPPGAAFAPVEPDAVYRGGFAFVRGLPDAPIVSATPGEGEAVVTLQAPGYTGGGTIASYTVTASPGGATMSGTSGPFTFTGLSNGTAYTFSATATTEIGTGPAGVATVTPRTIPGAPTGVTGEPGDQQVIVSFVPPASDGGEAPSSYTVTASPGPRTATGTSSPITVTGLHNDTSYTFTVTASNSAGAGPPSAPSDTVVPHEGGRPHHSAPDPVPRPDVPDVPAITTPRKPPPHHGP